MNTITPEQCIEQGYCRPKHRATKDTKRWCKGKPGRLHRFLWQEDLPYVRTGWIDRRRYVLEHPVCLDCGKHGVGYRRRCKVCLIPSQHGDYGAGGWWGAVSCPVCYADWRIT